MTKITYVNAINTAIKSLTGETISDEVRLATIEKLVALGQSLEKRNASKSGKPTKKQAENEDVKRQILGVLTTDGKRAKEVADTLGISVNKASALLKQLVEVNLVVRTEDVKVEGVKGKCSVFSLPEVGE